jgi:GMP synthase PP-ATPase subunit
MEYVPYRDECLTAYQEEFIGKEIARIREICGPKGRVIGAVSGGVDSTVAAKLMHEAIGDRQVKPLEHKHSLLITLH